MRYLVSAVKRDILQAKETVSLPILEPHRTVYCSLVKRILENGGFVGSKEATDHYGKEIVYTVLRHNALALRYCTPGFAFDLPCNASLLTPVSSLQFYAMKMLAAENLTFCR